MVMTDRLAGAIYPAAFKNPVLVASTGNLSLTGTTQVIDGATPSANDRVLVKDQTTTTENGIWTVQSSSWIRAQDFDGSRDVVRGTAVYASTGTIGGGGFFIVTSTGDNVPGRDAITFSLSSVLAVSSAVTVSNFISGSGFLTSTSTANARTVLRAADKLIPITATTSTSVTITSSDHGTVLLQTNSTAIHRFDNAATLGAGWWCNVRHASSGCNVSVQAANGEKLNGSGSAYTMVFGEGITFWCDGSALYSDKRIDQGFLDNTAQRTGSVSFNGSLRGSNNGDMNFLDASTGDVTINLPSTNETAGEFGVIGPTRIMFTRVDAVSSNVCLIQSTIDTINGSTAFYLPSQFDFAGIIYNFNTKWRTFAQRQTFVSATLAITANTALSADHGLGLIPREAAAHLVCLVSTGGYSTGREVLMSPNVGAASTGFTLAKSSTAIFLNQGAQLRISDTTGAVMTVNSTSWAWRIRAEA